VRRFLSTLAASFALISGSIASAQTPYPAQTSRDTSRYTVLFSDRPGGALLIWGTRAEWWADYQFNDRGRGPHVVEHVVAGADGIPRSLTAEGHDYLKDTVDEQFSTDGRTMRWTNNVEGDQRGPARAGYYVDVGGAPSAALVQALLAAPRRRLPLLPAGTAALERVRELTVRSNGRSETVVEWAVSGLGFDPTPVWLDADGQLFGEVSSFTSLIRGGWESVVPAMIAAQDSASAVRLSRVARTLARRPAVLVFRHAAVFDADSARLRPRTTVVIRGGRIDRVGNDDSVAIPIGATVIDAAGKTLMPGLWDMHVHVQPGSEGILHIAAGVTTIRDMGNDTTTVLQLKRQFDDGQVIGPRLVLAGLIDSPGPYQVPIGVLASTEAEARAAVDRYAALGFEQIKIYSSMKPELVPVIIDEAHKHGLRVSGHVPAFMTAEQVVRLGFDEVQHVNFLMLNFMDTVKDTRAMSRFTAVAVDGAALDLQSERVRQFLQLLKDRGTDIDPTVGTFEDMFVGRPRTPSPSFAAIADRLPAQVRRGLYGNGLPVPPGMDQRYRDSYAAMIHMVGAAYRAGIPIVAGTDGFPGFLYDRELELYVQAGIPAPAVLQLATLGAARIMHHDAERGSITEGKQADVILVDGDPTTRINDIRKVELTVRGGVVYRRADLYRVLGITAGARN
jgi:imidazolonepropionase-like amidohydrolase